MKKTLFVVLVFFAAVCGVFAQSGSIREMSGDVTLKPAGSTDFTAAKAGDKVAQDTIVSTGFKSTAVITIGSSTLTVRPLTRLSLAEIQSASGTEKLNVELQAGRVKVDVKPPAGTKANMTIQSPGATASVRGTSFEFDTVNLDVIEGKVAFNGEIGTATMVQGGESSFVVDGQPVPPFSVTTAALLPPAPVGTASETPAQPVPHASTGNVDVTIDWE